MLQKEESVYRDTFKSTYLYFLEGEDEEWGLNQADQAMNRWLQEHVAPYRHTIESQITKPMPFKDSMEEIKRVRGMQKIQSVKLQPTTRLCTDLLYLLNKGIKLLAALGTHLSLCMFLLNFITR